MRRFRLLPVLTAGFIAALFIVINAQEGKELEQNKPYIPTRREWLMMKFKSDFDKDYTPSLGGGFEVKIGMATQADAIMVNLMYDDAYAGKMDILREIGDEYVADIEKYLDECGLKGFFTVRFNLKSMSEMHKKDSMSRILLQSESRQMILEWLEGKLNAEALPKLRDFIRDNKMDAELSFDVGPVDPLKFFEKSEWGVIVKCKYGDSVDRKMLNRLIEMAKISATDVLRLQGWDEMVKVHEDVSTR